MPIRAYARVGSFNFYKPCPGVGEADDKFLHDCALGFLWDWILRRFKLTKVLAMFRIGYFKTFWKEYLTALSLKKCSTYPIDWFHRTKVNECLQVITIESLPEVCTVVFASFQSVNQSLLSLSGIPEIGIRFIFYVELNLPTVGGFKQPIRREVAPLQD